MSRLLPDVGSLVLLTSWGATVVHLRLNESFGTRNCRCLRVGMKPMLVARLMYFLIGRIK